MNLNLQSQTRGPIPWPALDGSGTYQMDGPTLREHYQIQAAGGGIAVMLGFIEFSSPFRAFIESIDR